MARNVKKAFEAHKLEGDFTRTVYDYEEVKNAKGKLVRQRTETKMTEKAGYMVYFPNGSSIHVRSDEEMERLGFDHEPDLIDLDTGEIDVKGGSTSLKRKAERIDESAAERKKFREPRAV